MHIALVISIFAVIALLITIHLYSGDPEDDDEII